jgi:REP element-mobilizing transposase RayT
MKHERSWTIALRLKGYCVKQSSFGFLSDYKKEFGGSLLVGKRRSVRPLSTKLPLHLVLKCSGKAYSNPGNRSFEKILRDHARKFGLKIYDISLNWSHIHLLILIPNRPAYTAFIRSVNAALVRFISAKLGKILQQIFDLRPYTRILSWGREFLGVQAYLKLNDQEARGLLLRKKKSLKKMRRDPPPKLRTEL